MRLGKRLLPWGISILGITSTAYAHDDYSLNSHVLLTGEFVYMRRSRIHDHSIVTDPTKHRHCPDCDFSILDTENVMQSMDYEPGYKVTLTVMPTRRWSLELNYLWLEEFSGEKKRHHTSNLTFPFDRTTYTKDYHLADKVKAKYESRFWDAEVNFWYHMTPRRVDYFSVSPIAGLRYVNLKEHFDLIFLKGSHKSNYDIHTTNHLGGVQLGLNIEVNPTWHWTWEVSLKGGVLWDYSMHNVFLGDNNNTTTLRKFYGHKHHVDYLADALATLGYQLNSFLNIHVGYQMIYIYGLALAPEQLSKGVASTSGESVYTKGEIILYGLIAGLSIGF